MQSLERRVRVNKLFSLSVQLLSYSMLIPLLLIFVFILKKGSAVVDLAFISSASLPSLSGGAGVLHAILGTLLSGLYTTLIAVPVGCLVGLYIAEKETEFLAKFAAWCIDTLHGIPSIVLGIIAYTWVVLPTGKFSMLSAVLALSLVMLPLVVKATTENVKMVSIEVKEAAYALGIPYYRTVFLVIIPEALKGIRSGILLGLSRVCGETAPLLFTAFGAPFISLSLFEPVQSLPLLIYQYAMTPYPHWQAVAWGASLLLIFIILSLSLSARMLSQRYV